MIVQAAGIDTWSPSWWLEPASAAARHLAALCSGGGLYPDAIAGHRLCFHRAGLLWAEGHPGEGLAAPSSLPGALERLELALLEAGVPLPNGRRGEDIYGDRHEGFAGVRRLDSTVDLATSSSAEGVAIMAGVAAVARDLPRTKANVWWDAGGRLQTVAMHGFGGGRLLARVYDKGAESGEAARGRLLRPEDQRRWGAGYRRGVEELTGQYVREKFVSRFAPLGRASKGVTVAGLPILTEKLAGMLASGELTVQEAERLAGHLVLRQHAAARLPRRTRYRRQAQLREHGLVLADGVLQEVEVDLGAVIEAALDAPMWGADD